MSGQKIFFLLLVHVLCVALLMTNSPNVAGQAAKIKGGFFAKRLTMAAGLDYSLEAENIPAAAGIQFSPQLFLTTAYSDFSFSVATDLMLNYRMNNDAEDLAEELFFQLPALVHLNVGHGASKDFHNAVGGFFGVGWNVQYDGSTTVNGLAFDGGFRFWLLGQSLTLRFINLPGNEKIFSSGKIFFLQINLGKYLAEVRRNNKVSNFMKPYQK